MLPGSSFNREAPDMEGSSHKEATPSIRLLHPFHLCLASSAHALPKTLPAGTDGWQAPTGTLIRGERVGDEEMRVMMCVYCVPHPATPCLARARAPSDAVPMVVGCCPGYLCRRLTGNLIMCINMRRAAANLRGQCTCILFGLFTGLLPR